MIQQVESGSPQGEQSMPQFNRSNSCYLRTADLGLDGDATILLAECDTDAKLEPHFHHSSTQAPPGVQYQADESWICLDDGLGKHSPIAPSAVGALVAMGFDTAADPSMWTPATKPTKKAAANGWKFGEIQEFKPEVGGPNDKECLVWSGYFSHGKFGSELPAIRSQGVVNMSAEDLIALLMDSSRVNEYNKNSLGRTDEVVLSDGSDPDSCPFVGNRILKRPNTIAISATGGSATTTGTSFELSDGEGGEESVEISWEAGADESNHTTGSGPNPKKRQRKEPSCVGMTKVTRSSNKVTLVPKLLEFVTLLHCRALTDAQGGNGYIIVARATHDPKTTDTKGVTRAETLLTVHIIQRLDKTSNRCLMTNVNHLSCPIVPTWIAKKVGLSAATDFFTDIRALTS